MNTKEDKIIVGGRMKPKDEKKKDKSKDKAIEVDVYFDPDGLKETADNPMITKIPNIKDFWKEDLKK